jgi:hypothetical protein
MAEPSFLSGGEVNQYADTRLIRLLRILGSLQNRAGANPANNPNRRDTPRRLLVKMLRALNGT